MVMDFLTVEGGSGNQGEGIGKYIHTSFKRNVRNSFLEVRPNLTVRDLGVVDCDEGFLREEIPDKGDRRGFTSVSRIGLERESQDRDTLQCK